MDGVQIGRAVAEARQANGLKQQELADLLGIDRQYLDRLEQGHTTLYLERLVAALDALGLELVVHPRTVRLASEEMGG